MGALAFVLSHVDGSLSCARRLLLDKNQGGPAGFVPLFSSLGSGAVLPELEMLNVGGNALGDRGLGALSGALRSGGLRHMMRLQLGDVDCGDEGASALAAALAPAAADSCADSPAPPPSAGCPAAGCLPELRELDLADNNIGDDGFSALADALCASATSKLERLTVSSNEIGDVGAARLGSALLGSPAALRSLVELSLDNNWVGDEGVKALARAFEYGRLARLHILALDDNMIADAGAGAFADACLSQPAEVLVHLESLDLDGSDIGERGSQRLAEALDRGALPALKTLEVDDDQLSHVNLNEACQRRGVNLR